MRVLPNSNRAASSEFGTYSLCEQSRQNLRCSLIQAVSQEEPSDRKPDPWHLWMAGHAQLKFVITECWKTQIAWRGPIKILNTLFITNGKSASTTQSLYNTIVGVQDNFRVSYPNRVITRVKCIGYIAKGILSCYLGSNSDPCYIQDRAITNRVIKRFRCNSICLNLEKDMTFPQHLNRTATEGGRG